MGGVLQVIGQGPQDPASLEQVHHVGLGIPQVLGVQPDHFQPAIDPVACQSQLLGDSLGSLDAAIEAGATAILQPGGSVRDDEVVAACDRLGATMVFTGQRHFRH